MPYCVQCGQKIGAQDKFCAKCGTAQKGSRGAPPPHFMDSISHRNMILLCYIPWVGWLAAIAVLGSPRFRADNRVRFHAFQGLYLFVAWLLVEWVLSPMFGFGRGPGFHVVPQLLHLVVFIAWVFMIVKVSHDEDYHLPIIGELAARSAAEQH